ncbi:hypothetical protein Lal_00046110 [Lupinus albus]|nr:hypothetical protein Lal_00046110 [Lupinus albus]
MDNCLMLITKVGEISDINQKKDEKELLTNKDGGFKCKTCNKRFSSFQALGGHRASHKKQKLMLNDISCHHNHESLKRTMKSKMHPCPICGVGFRIGQALGGHMRKHRAAINHGLLIHNHDNLWLKKSNLCLDLNLAPPENDIKLRAPV